MLFQPALTSRMLLSILILTIPSVLQVTATSCFWPNGNPAGGYVPCNLNPAETGNRPCCGNNEVCLSNSVCFSPVIGIVYRGACTDQTWNDPNCPKFFLKENPNATVNMLSCDNGYFRSQIGSCSDTDVFKWTRPQVIGIETATNLASTSTTATATATSTTSSTSTLSAQLSDNCDSAKRTTGLGVGLGLGLPLLAAIVALALLWRSSRKRTSSPAHEGVLMVPEERPTRGKGYGASEIAGQQLQEMDGLGANR